MSIRRRLIPSPSAAGVLALGLALGWGLREAHFASAQGKRIANATVTPDQVSMNEAQNDGKVVGKAGVYVDGETPSLKSLQVGRMVLDPGTAPHAPHTHPEEELLIVSRGQGEVVVQGKTVAAKAGSVMYVNPSVEHGIKNTGERPLEFYWVKYLPQAK